jgi:hypothetical protein
MEGCQGSPRRLEVNGRILSRILDCCPKLCNLDVVGTEIRSYEFYRHLVRFHYTLSFRFSDVSEETMLCYLKESARIQNTFHTVLLNGESRELEEMITILSQNS